MINLLESITNTITSLVGYVISTIQSFINMLTKIPQFITYILSLVDLLPTIFKVFIVVSISVMVIQYILGRN